MKLLPVLSNLSFKVALSLSLVLTVGLSNLALAQSDNGDLKSESESQSAPAASGDDSMNSLWAEPQDAQKAKNAQESSDSSKKSKAKSKTKAKPKTDEPTQSKNEISPATDSKPIDLAPAANTNLNSAPDSDLSTPIMIQPAPPAMGETTITDVAGLCPLATFQNSDLVRSSAWPGVGPFTADNNNKFVDPQENKLRIQVDGDYVTACELLLNNQTGSKQSFLNLEMTCDFMLEALGAKGNRISEFNTFFEKNKDRITSSKVNSESQVKLNSGAYVMALASSGPNSGNTVLIQVTSKNKTLSDDQSLVSLLNSNKTNSTEEEAALTIPTSSSTATTTTTTTKTTITKTALIKPTSAVSTATKTSKPAVKPTKVETPAVKTETEKTEAAQPQTKDPLRDELAGAIRSWQTIKKSALKDRNPASLSKILSGDLLKRQTDSIKALTESKHYYELTPKGVVVEKYTELSSSPQKYSVFAKVMELTKIMKDGAAKPDKETDDTYNVNYTVERSGDHWTISNSLLLVKKK